MSDQNGDHLFKRTLAYLGFKGEPDEAQIKMVEDAIREAKRYARPQFVYRFIKLIKEEDGSFAADAPLDVSYGALQKMFTKGDSDVLCILVSTLGSATDARIARLGETDQSRMVLVDAASNALIEEETNAFQKRLGLKEETFRFAPGYGDVPLTMQKEIFDLMPEIKKIGIELDESNFMHPMKSMTGPIGFKG